MHNKNSEIEEYINLRACSYINWHKKFRKITYKSVCIPLPENVVKYLQDETIILPKECYNDEVEVEFEQSSSDTSSSNEQEENEEETKQPEFPILSNQLKEAVSSLGGSVFIKTNWHCPKDAFWISVGQTMCCKDFTDIYQLLKASSICKEDLIKHSSPISEYEIVAEESNISDTDCSDDGSVQKDDRSSLYHNQFLILKKWHDIHPGTEFRCFVKNKKIIGISPRDWPQYHAYICIQRFDIVNDIVSLFRDQIKPKFPLYDYIFDVVRDTTDGVFLIDFSPFSEKYSESLAFEWSELLNDALIIGDDASDDKEAPEFRYLSSDCGIQPNKRNNYGIPKDVIDMFQASDSVDVDKSSKSNTLDDVINNRLENIWRNQSLEDETED